KATPSLAIYPLSLHAALPICFPPTWTATGEADAPPAISVHARVETRASPRIFQSWRFSVRCLREADPLGDTIAWQAPTLAYAARSEEHTSELQSRENLVCRLL